ncbi:Protein GrpE [Buchnera aphidicola (Phyllaphis fagi)]
MDEHGESQTIDEHGESQTIDEHGESQTIDEHDEPQTIDEHDEYQIINQLNEKLDNIKKNTRDIQLRTQANIENVIKQTEQKKYQITQDNLKYFLETLSLNINNLNIIINNTKNGILENHTIIQGLKLIIKSLSNTFQKFKKN